MRLPVNHALPLAAVLMLAACGGGDGPKTRALPAPASGPAADYPVVIGEPYTVGKTTWTPIDRLNYDEVGRASLGIEGGEKISAAHKTLPLPSYVEVTSLASGKTILVRAERRGPMNNDTLIELSPGAAAQLGVTGISPVRVRRVNPPETERSALRSGQRAPERIETPKGLLEALSRKLERQGGTTPAKSPTLAGASDKSPGMKAPRPLPAPSPMPTSSLSRSTVAVPTARPASAPARASAGAVIVQIAAFSNKASAEGVASKIGGQVSPAGRLWRVRSGPFATRREAEAALAKARSAGYSDARIQHAD